MKEKIIKIIRLLLPIVIGFIVGYFTRKSFNANLYNKPLLYPPKALFPIAWIIIYLLIGLSYLLYRNKYNNKNVINAYYLNLILNFTWPILFFGFNWWFISVIFIILLDISTILLMIKYYQESKISTYLLIPYLIWLLFATYLNISFIILN